MHCFVSVQNGFKLSNGGKTGVSNIFVKPDLRLKPTPVTTVLMPCLAMLQRVRIDYKGHQISEEFDTNEEVKWNLIIKYIV